MVHTMDNSTRESLKNELRNSFPSLSEIDLNRIDDSLEAFIVNVSGKIAGNSDTVVREKVAYLQSKVI